MNGYDAAFEHPVLNGVMATLERARISGVMVQDEAFQRTFVQAGWLATFIANSESHKHRRKALLFAALAKLLMPDNATVEALCYTVFARTGTLPASMHLGQLVGEKQEYIGPGLGPLSDEFLASYADSHSDMAGGMVLTKFQKDLATSLPKERCGVISAPTSAGKSFIVHEYVKSRFRAGEKFTALFVVPSKALIAQICAIYRRFKVKENVDLAVHSSVPENMIPPQGSAVLALTQERCIRLLATPVAPNLSFIFADEIQSLEDGDRGTLLEYVLHELRIVAPQARIFAAGPFIGNGRELGYQLFDEDCRSIDTEDAPVSQIVVSLSPLKDSKQLQVRVIAASREEDHIFALDTDHALYSKWKSSQSKAIGDALRMFATGSPSIVYAPGPKTAQNWAHAFVANVEEDPTCGADINDLITYIREAIHPECSLVASLARRVAYHHGGLPDFVREEIEELFSQHELTALFCTNTLLAGVNLPADKIFVVSPKKADEALTPFEFKNLIGRAGRLDQHLCGMVYCIQVDKTAQTDWMDPYRAETKKEVKPTVDERLASSLDAIRSVLANGTPVLPEDDTAKLRGTVTILRSRFLRGREYAAKYLRGKKLSEDQQNSLLDALAASETSLVIPPELALRNPYVDPVLQNQLYVRVREDSGQWIIRREQGFASDFEGVFKQLDDIFHIISEIAPIGIREYYRTDLLTFAKLWLRGRPFKDIVTRALPSRLRHVASPGSDEVDKAINKAMDFITKDVSYVTAKYFGVLADVIEALIPEEERAEYAMTVALPTMLELGCSDAKPLALITACIPRGAAIKIASCIPDEAADPVAWLTLHQRDPSLQHLPSIYHKILRRVGVWE